MQLAQPTDEANWYVGPKIWLHKLAFRIHLTTIPAPNPTPTARLIFPRLLYWISGGLYKHTHTHIYIYIPIHLWDWFDDGTTAVSAFVEDLAVAGETGSNIRDVWKGNWSVSFFGGCYCSCSVRQVFPELAAAATAAARALSLTLCGWKPNWMLDCLAAWVRLFGWKER